MSESNTAPGWNRECVICGHKWMGLENDTCPACIARCERMWAAASGNMSDSKTAERTCLVSWRPLSEWERSPHLSEAMFAFPCKGGDTRYWTVSVVCDPDVYVDCLSDEDRRSGLWALVPYPYPQPEMTR